MAKGKKKRLRKREITGPAILARHKATRLRRHKLHGHSYSRGRTGDTNSWDTKASFDTMPGNTFDDEYTSYKKTRGKIGWNPNPESRGTENPTYLARNSVFNTQRVPIGELMQRSIRSASKLPPKQKRKG